ncbi:MAG TPA: hypothetical protein VKG38_09310 [Solirubrobacteraceae bacterium]|nr:hypothetical protein [Solirubrobacteraceae bacterium]
MANLMRVVRGVLGDRRLKVVCEVGYAAHHKSLRVLIVVRAINEGRTPVEVRRVSFRTDSGRTIMATPVAGRNVLPALLGDGQSVSLYFDKDTLDRAEQEDRAAMAFAVVADASSTEYLAAYPQLKVAIE